MICFYLYVWTSAHASIVWNLHEGCFLDFAFEP